MNKKLYVGNLNYDTTEETLRTAFAEYGEIVSVAVVQDRYTNRSRGFGFVEMATEEAAEAAMNGMNGKNVDGRELRVNEANPPRSRDNNRRGGGGGGYNRDRNRGGW